MGRVDVCMIGVGGLGSLLMTGVFGFLFLFSYFFSLLIYGTIPLGTLFPGIQDGNI